jgi:hypothetical protein
MKHEDKMSPKRNEGKISYKKTDKLKLARPASPHRIGWYFRGPIPAELFNLQ